MGGAVVCGIGFTISLLIANIAFEGAQLEQAKVGVLAAAVAAALGAWVVFSIVRRLPPDVRARQLAQTSADLVDLADEVDAARDHIRGPVEAPVTLVEYGDYECPYCSVAEVAIREVLAEFGDDLRYVWRHLPLNDVHRSAQTAAEAAEAAAAQGAFWPMHDLLITDPDELDPDDLDGYAQQLGLDRDRFWDDIRRHVHVGRVADDVASADASGVAGTPTFFINGRRHEGAYDASALTDAIAAARRRAAVTAASA